MPNELRTTVRTRRRFALGAMLLGVAVVGLAGCTASRLRTSKALAERSEPYAALPERPTTRLLVVGDSTAVGTGASSPAASVAGLIGRDHPDWRIVNRAADGARFGDIVEQLAQAPQSDVVLVMAGGNDVIRATGEAELRQAVFDVALRASRLAPAVILMPAGNVGNAPFFWPPLSWWMSRRAKTLHAVAREAAQQNCTEFVDLFKDKRDDPFAQQPQRMNAADGLHPSDDGYALWYASLREQALDRIVRARLAAPGERPACEAITRSAAHESR